MGLLFKISVWTVIIGAALWLLCLVVAIIAAIIKCIREFVRRMKYRRGK